MWLDLRSGWGRHGPVVRGPVLVLIVLVGEAAEEPPALPGDLRRIQAEVLSLGHLDGDRPEILEPGRAAEGAAADADAADQPRFVARSNLHHLHPHGKPARQVADELPEVHSSLGGKVE